MKCLRFLALLLVWLPALLLAQDSNYHGSKDKLDVYLLIGQSNMAGRSPYTKAESGVLKGCYLMDDKGEWVPAKNPLNLYSTIRKNLKMQKMDPGYYFAKTMEEKEPGVSIGLVVNAKGGTKIEQWAKGTRFYKEALRRAREAEKTGTLKGILWHQGESNAKNPEGYLKKLAKLIHDLRTDLGKPDLPFVAGQVHDVPAINTQIAELPKTVPHTAVASSEGLKTFGRWHFDGPSMKLLGERFAEAMLPLVQQH